MRNIFGLKLTDSKKNGAAARRNASDRREERSGLEFYTHDALQVLSYMQESLRSEQR